MKRFIITLFLFICCAACVFAQGSSEDTYTRGNTYKKEIATIQTEIQELALTAYPVPKVTNFLERKVISDWIKRWDVPNTPCYAYIFIGQTCIGYFITNGKPVSNSSFIIPEEYDIYDVSMSGTHMNAQSMDIDGTYGANQPGWRMFLASGQAVGLEGYTTGILYSDKPIPSLSERLLSQ